MHTEFLLELPNDKACLCLILNPLNAKLNPICHLLALLGAHHILHISRIRVKLAGVPGVARDDKLGKQIFEITWRDKGWIG
jgi:hypothetical protein